MNTYRMAMEHCAPPAELEARLEQKVLAFPPAKKRPVIRPRSFARRVLLAAVLTMILTVGVGAAVLLDWDKIFADRFGNVSATLPVTETAFQEVNVTAVCDDVTLTVRQALGDSKTIYLILDYQLPEGTDLTALAEPETVIGCPPVNYYATGDMTWEDFRAADREKWDALDWEDYTSYHTYLRQDNALEEYDFVGGSTSGKETKAYDPDTGTVTYLLWFTTDSPIQNLTDQPLTLLVLPPAATVKGEEILLADRPAIITFRPEYTAQVRTGEARAEDKAYTVKAEVSPFTISVKYYGGGYRNLTELRDDMTLVMQDGTSIPVGELGQGLSGGQSHSEVTGKSSLHYKTQFREILNTEQVAAVRIGEIEIPLTDEI